MMKKALFIFLVIFSFLFVSSSQAVVKKQTTHQSQSKIHHHRPKTIIKDLDEIVAVVNNDVITQSELNKKIALIKKQMKQSQYAFPSAGKLHKQVLNSIIDMRLQLQIAKRAGMTVSNAELNKAISHIAKSNNMTLTEFKSALAKDGISYTDFRNQIQEQILMSKVQQQTFAKDITVSNEEVAAYLKKHSDLSLDQAQAKRKAQEAIYRDKFTKRLKGWLKKLRASSYIKIYGGSVKK